MYALLFVFLAPALALQAQMPAFSAQLLPAARAEALDVNGTMATCGEFADLSPADFHGAFKRDGAAVALREFVTLFQGR